MPHFPPPQLIQTAFAEISVDTTTSSGTFVDLLTVTLTTGPTRVEIYFTVSANNTSAFLGSSPQFQIVLDGSAVRGAKLRLFVGAQGCVSIRYRTGQLSIGSHTIKAQWLTDVGTVQVRPVTTILEHASLLVKEVTV